MRLILHLCLLSITSVLNAQENVNSLTIGDTVPNYSFRIVEQNKTQIKKLSDFKGKAIIIDFWATWCAPCLERMQELHKLYQPFKKAIVVLAISDESTGKIRQFIKNTGYTFSYIKDSSFRDYFPHKIIPHTVIIDKEGKVCAITEPEEITLPVLTALANNRSINLKVKDDFQLLAISSDSTDRILYKFEITKYNPQKNTSVVKEDDRLEFNNFTLPSLFREIFQLPAHSWIVDSIKNRHLADYKPENMYCLKLYKPKNSSADLYKIGQNIVSTTLPIEAIDRIIERTVYTLKLTDESKLKLSKNKEPKMQFYGPNYEGLNQPISVLVDYLGNEKGYLENAPVIDETNLKSNYDIILNWAYEKPETLREELQKYGLILVPEKRKIKCLVLTD